QQFADRHDRRRLAIRHDHARFRIIVENQFAARSAWRHDGNGPIFVLWPGMAHRDDGVDSGIAEIDNGMAERDGFGADRHAAEISVEIDAGEDFSRTRAQRRADLLPVATITALDGRPRRGDQLLIGFAELRPLHFANSLKPSLISVVASAPSPTLRAATATAAAACACA